jgi:hypothetical protein
MWNISRAIILLFLFSHVSWAQALEGVTFTLNTKNDQISFRQGEAIPVELSFRSSAPGIYLFTDRYDRVLLASSEGFSVEPASDAFDPLREMTRLLAMPRSFPPNQTTLTSSPIIIDKILNEYISFRKTGRYYITAQTNRLSTIDYSKNPDSFILPATRTTLESLTAPSKQPPKPPIRSNTIEIEIVAAENGWAEKQVAQAVASLIELKAQYEIDQKGRISYPEREKKILNAVRLLRFLETRAAAVAMVRFFDRGLQLAQPDLLAGLYGSPCRNEVIFELEKGLTSPEIPATQNWMDTLVSLVTGREFGPAPRWDKDESGYNAWSIHYEVNRDHYMAILANAVESKKGEAKAVSLDILSYRYRPKPPASSR